MFVSSCRRTKRIHQITVNVKNEEPCLRAWLALSATPRRGGRRSDADRVVANLLEPQWPQTLKMDRCDRRDVSLCTLQDVLANQRHRKDKDAKLSLTPLRRLLRDDTGYTTHINIY